MLLFFAGAYSMVIFNVILFRIVCKDYPQEKAISNFKEMTKDSSQNYIKGFLMTYLYMMFRE